MSELTGTGTLLRLAWRRDRVLIPVALLALTALSVGSAQATLDLYPTEAAAKAGLGSVLANPAVEAMYGPIAAENLGALAVFKTVVMGAVFVALLAYAVVRRHTRVEEEVGRLELVGAGVVGRRAPLTAAMLLAGIAVVAAGLLSALGLIGIGLDAAGSVGFGVAWVIAGIAMVGVTAVAAQLTTSARACAGIALSVLAVMFVLRAVGDTAGGGAQVLSWASPLGWANKVGAYGPNRFWVLGLAVALAAVLVGLAYSLLDRRDVGAGLLPSRPGPASARPSLGTPTGLTWRLTRPSVVGWLAAFVVLGGVLGSLVTSVADMASDPAVVDMLRKLGGSAGSITDIFLATELAFVGVAAAAAGIGIALRVASEERSGRGEEVLATATSRSSWLGAHALIAFALPTVLLLVLALVVGLGAGGQGEVPGVSSILGAAAARIPAVLVLVAVALLASAALPRWAPAIGWGALAVAFALGELGATIGLPDWLVKVSPFAHVPQLPGGEFTWTPVLVTTAVAAAITAAAFAAYRARDVA
ncbi:ABC-2 type transport system permease protein [Knoellia remsis]|uniref:ABC-2 type transport system permease protein n=1 Tax=Knoellia remsis TaxID=407159 RepID=A0A2T0UQL9_9MICO|nr:polyketide antibiotic transporter [Knoellia remsis]PRY60127.1 ABC-2 type transport system permease protein [Knoellia remsis]